MYLDATTWLFAVAGALLIGLAKGGLPGVGYLTPVLYATVFVSAKESVGVLLPVLMAADLIAVTVYRRHAAWNYVVRLFPWTAGGVIIGWLTMGKIDDETVRRLIGSIVVVMAGVHFVRKWLASRNPAAADSVALPQTFWFTAIVGVSAGFATMIGNAAGPIGQVFFLSAGLPKMAFIGTGAWFFMVINWFKVPFMINLGILNFDSFAVSTILMIPAVTGALIAPFLVRRIHQKVFEALVWFFVVLVAINLVI